MSWKKRVRRRRKKAARREMRLALETMRALGGGARIGGPSHGDVRVSDLGNEYMWDAGKALWVIIRQISAAAFGRHR